MRKVKIFTDYTAPHLEAQINEWVDAAQAADQRLTIESVLLTTVGQPSPINPLPDTHYNQLFATVVYRFKKEGKNKKDKEQKDPKEQKA